MFYSITLFIHSWLRWLVLFFAIWAILRAVSGWLGGRKTYTGLDNGSAAAFVGSLHLQLLIGLILYFISPLGFPAIQNSGMGTVMKNSALRFYAIEHITTMIIAVVLAQIGRSRSKRAKGVRKHRIASIFFIIALVLILARVPWDRLFRTSL